MILKKSFKDLSEYLLTYKCCKNDNEVKQLKSVLKKMIKYYPVETKTLVLNSLNNAKGSFRWLLLDTLKNFEGEDIFNALFDEINAEDFDIRIKVINLLGHKVYLNVTEEKRKKLLKVLLNILFDESESNEIRLVTGVSLLKINSEYSKKYVIEAINLFNNPDSEEYFCIPMKKYLNDY